MGLSNQSDPSTGMQKYSSPLHILLVASFAGILSEVLVMVFLYFMHVQYEIETYILDVTLTTFIVFPVVYFFLIRPLIIHMRERQQAEEALIAIHVELEERIQQRTAELLEVNQALLKEVEERKKVEQILRAKDNNLQLFLSQIPAVLWSTDRDLRIQSVSGLGLTGFNTSPERLVGRRFTELLNPDLDKTGIHKSHLMALEGITSTYDFEINERSFHGHVEPLRNSAGEIEGIVGIAVDIMEKKQADEKIRLLSTALESAANGIVVTDRDGKIEWANQAFSSMTGYQLHELIGQAMQIIRSTQHSEPFYQNLWETILSGKVWHGEIINRRKDGCDYTEDQTITPVINSQGNITHFIAIQQDISERKTWEKAIQKRNLELGMLNSIGSAVSGSLDIPEIVQNLQKVISTECHIAAGLVYLFDDGREAFCLEGDWGFTPDSLLDWKILSSKTEKDLVITKSRDVVWIDNLQQYKPDSSLMGMAAQLGWQSCLVVPLLVHDQILGIVALFNLSETDANQVARLGDSHFGPDQNNFYRALGHQVGLAIQNAMLYKTEQQARQISNQLLTTSLALTKILKVDVVLETLLDHLQKAVPYDSALVILLEDEHHFSIRARRGRNWNKDLEYTLLESISRLENPAVQALFTNRKSILIPKSNNMPALFPIGKGDHDWLVAPLSAGERVIGLCVLGNSGLGRFTQQHTQMAEALASQVTVAIQNAWLFEQVRSGNDRLQSLSRRLVEIQENERRYIARELHDEASQALASLVVGLDLLQSDPGNKEKVIAMADDLGQVVDSVLGSLHQMAMDLRPASLDHLGLVPAVQQYILSIREKYKLDVQFEAVKIDQRLPGEMEIVLYRIVQEALINVVRHAHATRADVILEQRGSRLLVLVEDNGVGFDTDKALNSDRLGLFGIRERADMLGGKLIIESTPGRGTIVKVEVPHLFPETLSI